MLDFLAVQIRTILANTHGAASLMGLAAGVFLSAALPYLLPQKMDPYLAERTSRLSCFGLSACINFSQDPSAVGFCLAIITGLAGPTIWQFVTRWLYARYPSIEPKALKP
jgi:hypothetical protein